MIDVNLFASDPADIVLNQGQLNECTGEAGVTAVAIMYARKGRPLQFSGPFLWWQSRVLSGTTGQNVGVSPPVIGVAFEQFGCCLASSMPDGTPFDQPPSAAAIAEALQYRATGSVSYGLDADPAVTIARVQQSLLKGQVVCVTLNVDAAFEALGPGVPWQGMTWNPDGPSLGLHENVLGAYSCATKTFGDQNSWGNAWGAGGFTGIPESLFIPSVIVEFTEITPACGLVNAGWRPDLTPSQIAIQQLYVAYFGRPADVLGLGYWDNVYAQAGVIGIIDAFANSAESHALYPDISPTAVITAAYQNLFGRAPEPDGLAYWLNVVAQGWATVGAVIVDILGGAQGTDLESINAKVEAAGVITWNLAYATADIPAARAWLASITTAAQVQSAVENPPF